MNTNHLEEAKAFISEPGTVREPEIYNQMAIAHALIAIAERAENLGYEIRITREKLCLSLDAIAEQLEKASKSKSERAAQSYDSGLNDAFAEMEDSPENRKEYMESQGWKFPTSEEDK